MNQLKWELIMDNVDLIPVMWKRTTLVSATCLCGENLPLQAVRFSKTQDGTLEPKILSVQCKKCQRNIVLKLGMNVIGVECEDEVQGRAGGNSSPHNN